MRKLYWIPSRSVFEYRSGFIKEEHYELSESLKGEDPAWLQIEQVDDGQGTMVDTVTVDAALKAQVQQQRLDAQLARETASMGRKKKRKKLRKKMRDFDKTELVGLEQLQDQIDDIVKFLEIHMGFEGD